MFLIFSYRMTYSSGVNSNNVRMEDVLIGPASYQRPPTQARHGGDGPFCFAILSGSGAKGRLGRREEAPETELLSLSLSPVFFFGIQDRFFFFRKRNGLGPRGAGKPLPAWVGK